MKKLLSLLTASLMVAIFLVADASAFITDPTLGFDVSGIANYTWNGQVGTLNITNAQCYQLVLAGQTYGYVANGVGYSGNQVSFTGMTLQNVDSEGKYWTFTGGSLSMQGDSYSMVGGSPVKNTAISGTLLTGDITSLCFNYSNPQDSQITGNFTVTDGLLKQYYEDAGLIGSFIINPYFHNGSVRPSNVAAGWETNNWTSVGLNGEVSPVPEPSSMMLMGGGLLGLLGFVRRKRS